MKLNSVLRYFRFKVIPTQNPWLDVLRAFAVLLVIFRHGEFYKPEKFTNPVLEWDPVHNLFMNGWIGVDLFFLLSGYLIAQSLSKLRSNNNQILFGRYMFKRILRIVPNYYAILFLTASGFFPLYFFPEENLNFRVFYHLLFMQDYMPADINVVFWSLGVEEKFYLIAPILIMVLYGLKNWRKAFILLLAIFLFSSLFRLGLYLVDGSTVDYTRFFRRYRSNFHVSLECLIAGVGISYFQNHGFVHFSVGWSKILLLSSFFILMLISVSHEWLSVITVWDIYAQQIMIAALFAVMVLCATNLNTVRVKAFLFWLIFSRLSYSLYLVHFPLIPGARALTETYQLNLLTYWTLYLIISVGAAAVLHFAVEKPFLILKDRMDKKQNNA